MPKGTQLAVMSPGTHEKDYLSGALDVATGTLRHGGGPRQTHALVRQSLQPLDNAYPAPQCPRGYVVADHDKIHQAKAVEQWLAHHHRLTRLLLPTYAPRAHPIERAFGDVHDVCTRNHPRKRWRLWCRMSKRISACMALRNTGGQTSTVSRRSPWRWHTSPRRNMPASPHECTNVVWIDLDRL